MRELSLNLRLIGYVIVFVTAFQPCSALADSKREQTLETALLHQYTNQILDYTHSREFCAQILSIRDSLTQTMPSVHSFETVVGVVTQNWRGTWEYLQMTIVDDRMGVRVTKMRRKSNLTLLEAMGLCRDKQQQHHEPLRNHFPARYVLEPVPAAEEVPRRFIQLLNLRRYSEARRLMSPNLQQAYSTKAGHQGLVNMKHIALLQMKDITGIKPVHYVLNRHYAIKAYAAIVDKSVFNPKLPPSRPGSIGQQVNTFVVIRFTPDSPWVLDAQMWVPPATAKLWGLDIGKNDPAFCRRDS